MYINPVRERQDRLKLDCYRRLYIRYIPTCIVSLTFMYILSRKCAVCSSKRVKLTVVRWFEQITLQRESLIFPSVLLTLRCSMRSRLAFDVTYRVCVCVLEPSFLNACIIFLTLTYSRKSHFILNSVNISCLFGIELWKRKKKNS